MTRSVQIRCRHFTAGLELDHKGVAVKAAPIIQWIVDNGWSLDHVIRYGKRRGWVIIDTKSGEVLYVTHRTKHRV